MIVNVVEIFTEYLSVILCEHKIAKKKIALDRYFWMFFLLDLFSILLAHEYREEHGWLMMLVYVNFFVYVKMRLCKKWADAVKVFGGMLILIPSMQIVIYFGIKFLLTPLCIEQIKGIIVNCVICIVIKKWKKNHLLVAMKRVDKSSSTIIIFVFCIILLYFLFLYKQSEYVYNSVTVQTLAGVIGAGIITLLWINAEREKKNKAKELQLYKVYNKTFEEAIIAIRNRQHEFDNHINALKCIQFALDEPEEIIKKQNEYYDKILKDNSFNKILKLHTEPILAGFLYSKFLNAKELGINVMHEIHPIKFQDFVEVSEMVEIIGILLDNAIEAMKEIQDIEKVIIVKILQIEKGTALIEIANKSRRYLNNEIEKFCTAGYSTKGADRGYGLPRIKEITKRSKADFYIENVTYNGDSYLSFKIMFRN